MHDGLGFLLQFNFFFFHFRVLGHRNSNNNHTSLTSCWGRLLEIRVLLFHLDTNQSPWVARCRGKKRDSIPAVVFGNLKRIWDYDLNERFFFFCRIDLNCKWTKNWSNLPVACEKVQGIRENPDILLYFSALASGSGLTLLLLHRISSSKSLLGCWMAHNLL